MFQVLELMKNNFKKYFNFQEMMLKLLSAQPQVESGCNLNCFNTFRKSLT